MKDWPFKSYLCNWLKMSISCTVSNLYSCFYIYKIICSWCNDLMFLWVVEGLSYIYYYLVIIYNLWILTACSMILRRYTYFRFTASSLQISRITPCLVKLLSDPTGQVSTTDKFLRWTQPVFTCSMLTMETVEQGLK